MAFCPACGKDAVDVFCTDCTRKQHPLVEKIEPITYTTCVTCDRMKFRSKWVKDDFFAHLDKAITFGKNAVIIDVDAPEPVIDPQVKDFILPFTVVGTVSKKIEPYEEEYEVEVLIEKELCEKCSLAKSSYFEGTLQLRNPKDEIVQFIEKRVQQEPEVYLTEAKDVRGGIDFKLTSQQWMHALAHEIHKKFGGELKTQSRLHTYDHQKSKKVFRLTSMIRIPKFWVGDVIESGKALMRVQHMGANVSGFDLRKRKKTSIPCPKDGEFLLYEPVNTILSSTQPKPMILDPQTYQEIPLAHNTELEAGAEVQAIEDDRGKWYLL